MDGCITLVGDFAGGLAISAFGREYGCATVLAMPRSSALVLLCVDNLSGDIRILVIGVIIRAGAIFNGVRWLGADVALEEFDGFTEYSPPFCNMNSVLPDASKGMTVPAESYSIILVPNVERTFNFLSAVKYTACLLTVTIDGCRAVSGLEFPCLCLYVDRPFIV
jgi:hypothetical protein